MPRTRRPSRPDRRPGPVPLIGVLRRYDRGWLRGDVVAGVAVAALIIPKNLGYAGIAGVPLQNGLYAAAVAALVYAFFGSCRQISMGPSSGLAAVAASAVVAAGLTDPTEVAVFVAGITLVSGLLFLVVALVRLSWIAQFLSRAVVTGFLFGAAIDVVVGELSKLTGTDVSGANVLREIGSWVRSLPQAHGPTVIVGVVALAVVFGLRRIRPGVPGALVLVAGGLLASWAFDLADRGVAVVGDIPSGLPRPSIPDPGLLLDHAGTVVTAAVALLLIGFSQTAGDARAFTAKHRYQVDLDAESVAQALANTASGLCQGMPVSTSLSASALNDRSGARSGVASLVSGAVVLLALLFLAPLFSGLPKPVLAALIIEAVVAGMMDVAALRRLARVHRLDFWIAITALVATVVVGVLAGVVVGVALSLVWLIAVTTHPPLPQLGRLPGPADTEASATYRDVATHPDARLIPDVTVLRVDGGVFFASADAVEDRVRELVDDRTRGLLVLDCEGVNFVDAQGSATFAAIARLCHESGLQLRLARVRSSVSAVLDADGVLDQIGPSQLYASVDDAVRARL